MCQINFTIQTNDNSDIVSGEGRWKENAGDAWNYFSISDINNALTPDINTDASYLLEIRVVNTNTINSAWTSVSGFQVGCP